MSIFLCLLPLAHQDFRSPISRYVTASDASMTGGGLCVSDGLTPYGFKVLSGPFRGENVDDIPERGVVCVGLFDGVGSLRKAAEVLRVNVHLHISAESDEHAKRVVKGHFNNVVQLDSVDEITPEMCQRWAGKTSGAGMVIVGAGQCQGVNRPNGERSGSVSLIQPVLRMLRKSFSWARFISFKNPFFNWTWEIGKSSPKQQEYCPFGFVLLNYSLAVVIASTG